MQLCHCRHQGQAKPAARPLRGDNEPLALADRALMQY
jgi:hypothetical protein